MSMPTDVYFCFNLMVGVKDRLFSPGLPIFSGFRHTFGKNQGINNKKKIAQVSALNSLKRDRFVICQS